MSCGDLVCEIVFYLVSNHHWGSNTIPIRGLVSNADCDADFDEKKQAYQTAITYNFVERVRQDHVRLAHTEELIEFLANCDGIDKMDVKPRLKRKYHDNYIFDRYFGG